MASGSKMTVKKIDKEELRKLIYSDAKHEETSKVFGHINKFLPSGLHFAYLVDESVLRCTQVRVRQAIVSKDVNLLRSGEREKCRFLFMKESEERLKDGMILSGAMSTVVYGLTSEEKSLIATWLQRLFPKSFIGLGKCEKISPRIVLENPQMGKKKTQEELKSLLDTEDEKKVLERAKIIFQVEAKVHRACPLCPKVEDIETETGINCRHSSMQFELKRSEHDSPLKKCPRCFSPRKKSCWKYDDSSGEEDELYLYQTCEWCLKDRPAADVTKSEEIREKEQKRMAEFDRLREVERRSKAAKTLLRRARCANTFMSSFKLLDKALDILEGGEIVTESESEGERIALDLMMDEEEDESEEEEEEEEGKEEEDKYESSFVSCRSSNSDSDDSFKPKRAKKKSKKKSDPRRQQQRRGKSDDRATTSGGSSSSEESAIELELIRRDRRPRRSKVRAGKQISAAATAAAAAEGTSSSS